MLIAAVACVGFAVYAILDVGFQPSQAQTFAEEPLTVPALATVREDETEEEEEENEIETEYEEEPEPVTPMLSFYIQENSAAYAAFQLERPELDFETVVWKVNASVHVPFYSEIRVNNLPNPLFVTPSYRLPDGFVPHELVPVNNEDCILLATPETVAAFRSMRAWAQNAGIDLSVTSAYRTATRQAELWENGGRADGAVARPHHSEHQTGRALDLWGPGGLLDASGPSPAGQWVAENAHRYGFIVRYRAETTHITGFMHEPWHLTYVGTEISMYMFEHNILSLEEFAGRNPHAILTALQQT